MKAEFMEVSTHGDFAVLSCSTRNDHFLLSLSFDGHFDLISKLSLTDKPVSLSKFRMEDVFMIATNNTIILYFVDSQGFYRIAKISNIDASGILSATVIPKDNEIMAITKTMNKVIILRK